MNRYVKAALVVTASASAFFFIARAFFASQMPVQRALALVEAQAALATAQALDSTLVFLVVGLIVGVWWARRRR